ncbi:PREDICTED: NEDD4-binding protein 1, partial [Myotis davidii]|uniref:NEDD4-binding protein 1 n=1 Tax=Myotis davidii TaxID=225400 RepID=UPI000767763B
LLQEYIKGVCEPELEEREHYPKAMHCIFVGAQGLFLKSLIQDTCADLCVLDVGLLSRESLPSCQKESEVKREFRQVVEARADNYTMDLLILPTSLKKELLALTLGEDALFEAGDDDIIEIRAPSEPDGLSPDVKDTTEEMEHNILVNFFKTMGYSQDIVEKVIREYGPSAEPLLLLEEIEKENRRSQEERESAPATGHPETSKNKHKGVCSSTNEFTEDSTPKKTQAQQNTVKKFSPLPFKAESKPCTSNCRMNAYKTGPMEQRLEPWGPHPNYGGNMDLEIDGFAPSVAPSSPSFVSRGVSGHQPRIPVFPENGVQPHGEALLPNHLKSACESRAGCLGSPQSRPNCQPLPPTPLPPLGLSAGFSDHIDSSVTGVQRFRDTLKVPYKLELKNEPGRTDLKHIVIDGSNVAITVLALLRCAVGSSSGEAQRMATAALLSKESVSAAAATARQHQFLIVSMFGPNDDIKCRSRLCPTPSRTEQHFLTQLQELGILSLTPARMVFGERIASHDDRFLLHLADKTGGIIVTNDNFREFVTESVSWREIITKRLLQYTFVGDIFMVPDDPLGRSGPRLEEFLRKEVFLSPDSEQRLKIDQILAAHPYMKDLNALSAMVLD